MHISQVRRPDALNQAPTYPTVTNVPVSHRFSFEQCVIALLSLSLCLESTSLGTASVGHRAC